MHRALNAVMMGLALYAVVIPGVWYGYRERADGPAASTADEDGGAPIPAPTQALLPAAEPQEASAQPPEPAEEPEAEEAADEDDGPVDAAHDAADQLFADLENVTGPGKRE